MTTLKERLKLGLHTTARAALLLRFAGRGTAKLYTSGVKPQSLYRAAVAGLQTPQRELLPSAARKVASPCGLMPCQLSATFLKLGVLPLPQVQKEQLALWAQVWDKAADSVSLTRAWRAIGDSTASMSLAEAWRAAAGPVAARVATLQEIGWPLISELWACH